MQLKIYKILNTLLFGIILIVVGLWLLFFFYLRVRFPEYSTVFLISLIVVDVLLFLFFKWLESGWDKRVITKMAKEGHIALANINGGERVMQLRDSSFTNYWLYSFDAELCLADGTKFQKTFYEKMNFEFSAVLQGSVYVTYDESKPSQIFIIPNVMISHLPELMPTVQSIERNKTIKIKYLDAYYKKGMVLKTMRQSVNEQRKVLKEQKRK